MKEFVVYTLLRIVLFLASLGVVIGVMALLFDGRFHLFWAVVLAFLVSGIASYFILERQRRCEDRRQHPVRRSRASSPRGPGGSTPPRRQAPGSNHWETPFWTSSATPAASVSPSSISCRPASLTAVTPAAAEIHCRRCRHRVGGAW